MMEGERRMFRALGGVDTGSAVPPGEAAEALRAEFERVFTLKRACGMKRKRPFHPPAGALLRTRRRSYARWSRASKAPACGCRNSSTSGDLDVFVDQPTETIDP